MQNAFQRFSECRQRRHMSKPPQEPTDEDVRYFADLCQCIGFVVVHWSLTEQQLDNWVNVCFNNCGGSKFQHICWRLRRGHIADSLCSARVSTERHF
jgi:hypothetical protein